MWTKLVVFLIAAGYISFTWSKPMYLPVHQRAELLEYNASCVTPNVTFTFKKFNRTMFALSTSFTTIRDLTDRKIMITIAVDKLFGTEFKRTGTSINLNLCKFWQSNMFGMRDQLSAKGNLEACNVVKNSYYLKDFVPNMDTWPRYLPYGSYRIDINIHHEDGYGLFKMLWFSRLDKLPK